MDELFHSKENRVSNLKQIIEQSTFLKKKKEKQTKEIQFNLNSRDGIISFLQKKFGVEVSKSIVLGFSSSSENTYNIESIFDWADRYWHSNNIQNCWFCVCFNHMKISLSGY
jgi:hypothetical protein